MEFIPLPFFKFLNNEFMKNLKKSFTEPWWENFLLSNNNFTEPCIIKNALDNNLIDILNKGVMEVLKSRLNLEHIRDGFRTYIEGEQQNDEYALALCKTPPLANENITEFTKRIFDKKFGLIINNGEKHSEIISEKIQNAVQPLLNKIGLPITGFEITLFIGNYGWTPLGIHQDHPGENVIHFHLGPGKKTMYTWDEEKYDELTGGKFNNMEIEPIVKHSKEFPFHQGDIYYMPWDKYHVGYSDELSVGITLWFNNPTKQNFAKKIVRSFVNQFANESDTEMRKIIIPPEHNYLKNKNSFTDLISALKIDDEILNSSTKNFLKHIYKDFKFCIMSNGGWQTPPLSRFIIEKYDVNDFKHLSKSKIKSKENFKLQYYTKKDILFVFVRGTKIEMKYHEKLETIIKNINTHNTYLVKKILEDLSKEWPIEAGLYFLSELYNYRGIEIV